MLFSQAYRFQVHWIQKPNCYCQIVGLYVANRNPMRLWNTRSVSPVIKVRASYCKKAPLDSKYRKARTGHQNGISSRFSLKNRCTSPSPSTTENWNKVHPRNNNISFRISLNMNNGEPRYWSKVSNNTKEFPTPNSVNSIPARSPIKHESQKMKSNIKITTDIPEVIKNRIRIGVQWQNRRNIKPSGTSKRDTKPHQWR